MKRVFVVFLAAIMLFSCFCFGAVPVEAASAPKWKANAVTNLSKTDAKISVKVTFSSKVTFTQGGFYIGTSKDNMQKNPYPDKCNIKSTNLTSSFLMSKYKQTLKPGTTYYYRTYVVANGKTYTSPVYSFKTKSEPKSPNTTWVSKAADITFRDANLPVSVKLPVKAKITQCGFSIGTSQTNLKKNAYPQKFNTKGNSLFAVFDLSKCKQTLKDNTTYYYQFYVISGGKTYTSDIFSFKTLCMDTYAQASTSKITKTNAIVTAKITNAAEIKATKWTLEMGTAKDKLKAVKTQTLKSVSGVQTVSYNLNSCGQTLKPNTLYYYRLGVAVDGKTVYTQTKSFQTESNATKIVFPLPTNKVWYCSTYQGHGGDNASARCAVDIKLKNKNSCNGLAVYAVADGVVINDTYKSSNGQITIKHTVPLTTINGKVYKTWYTTYAHMTNITVKKGTVVKAGQQIGKVGSVGKKSTGPHLHFTISSGNGGTGWYQKTNVNKAISPYYVYGFVNVAGQDTSYLIRDMEGPAVTKWLINHKPTGK